MTKSQRRALALVLTAWLGCGGKTDAPIGSGKYVQVDPGTHTAMFEARGYL